MKIKPAENAGCLASLRVAARLPAWLHVKHPDHSLVEVLGSLTFSASRACPVFNDSRRYYGKLAGVDMYPHGAIEKAQDTTGHRQG